MTFFQNVPRFTAFGTGEIAGSVSATQLPDRSCLLAMFKARSDNVGSVYIGVSGVTAADGTTDTTTGFELAAGEQTPWIPCSNTNLFYYISAVGDDFTYMIATG